MTLYDRNGKPREPTYAHNAKGKLTKRNFGTTRRSESTYECDGCGRKFSAFDLPYYSLALDSGRLYARNKGLATAHAARCKGTGEPKD